MAGVRAFETMTRAGFAARGIMYGLMGWLALRTGRAEDGADVLDRLATGIGRLLLAGMALGFLCYGLWRLAEAWIDSAGHGADAKGVAVRLGGAVSGLVHLGLGTGTAMLALGLRGRGEGGDSAETGAAAALDLPGGQWLLGLAAAALLLTALFQLRKAWKRDFLRHLAAPTSTLRWIGWLGRAGLAARGLVFLVMAWFLWRAGEARSSEEAGGMGEALAALPDALQAAVAVGLLLFGLFSLVEARYRRIRDPHVLARLRSAVA